MAFESRWQSTFKLQWNAFVALGVDVFDIEHIDSSLRLHWRTPRNCRPRTLDRLRAGVPTLSEDHPSNRILASLSGGGQLPWSEHLQRVDLPAGHEVHVPGTATAHVYFPTTALVALMQPTPGRGDVSVALVGNDGMLGVAAFMGDFFESGRAVVLHPGAAWTLPTSALTTHGPDSVQVTQAVLGYLQALTDQMSQTALCQRTHSVEQRLCRWLLMAFNRMPDDALAMDLGDLTVQLDVPIDVLSGAAARLVGLGVLAREPGRLRLLDRAALQALACDCHALAQSKRGM